MQAYSEREWWIKWLVVRISTAQDTPAWQDALGLSHATMAFRQFWGPEDPPRAGTGLDLGLGPNDRLLLRNCCMQGSQWAWHGAQVTDTVPATTPLTHLPLGQGLQASQDQREMVLNNSCHSDLLSTYCIQRASWLVPVVKNPPASAGDKTQARSPGGEGPLEEGVATYSSILGWRIPVDWWIRRAAKSQT